MSIVWTGMQTHRAPCIPQTPRATASHNLMIADCQIIYRSDVPDLLQNSVFAILSNARMYISRYVRSIVHSIRSSVVEPHSAEVCVCMPLPALLVRVWPLATKTHTLLALVQH